MVPFGFNTSCIFLYLFPENQLFPLKTRKNWTTIGMVPISLCFSFGFAEEGKHLGAINSVGGIFCGKWSVSQKSVSFLPPGRREENRKCHFINGREARVCVCVCVCGSGNFFLALLLMMAESDCWLRGANMRRKKLIRTLGKSIWKKSPFWKFFSIEKPICA